MTNNLATIASLDLDRVTGGAGKPAQTSEAKSPKKSRTKAPDWRDAPMGSWNFEDEKL